MEQCIVELISLIEKYARYGYMTVPTTSKTLDGQSTERKALTNKTDIRRVDMTDEEYMLFPAKLWGFSLADRKWSKSKRACPVGAMSDDLR